MKIVTYRCDVCENEFKETNTLIFHLKSKSSHLLAEGNLDICKECEADFLQQFSTDPPEQKS